MIWTPKHDRLWTPGKDRVFRIRKYRDLVRRIIAPAIGMEGWFRFEVQNADGRTWWLNDWQHNLITNTGLDFCATSTSRYSACQVGTGNTDPAFTDTTLQTYHAGTTTRVNISQTPFSSASPPYVESYVRYDFATGAVVGNMTEVGIGPSAASGQSLFSRELIRDAGGSPTSITLTSTQALRVHHRLRHYPPTVDSTGSITADLNGVPTSTAYTRRASEIDNYGYWGPRALVTPEHLFGTAESSGSDIQVRTGAIGVITAAPGGTAYGRSSVSTDAYSNGSFSRTFRASWNINTANATLASVLFPVSAPAANNNRAGQFQVGFSPSFTKTNTDDLTLEFLVSWGRYA